MVAHEEREHAGPIGVSPIKKSPGWQSVPEPSNHIRPVDRYMGSSHRPQNEELHMAPGYERSGYQDKPQPAGNGGAPGMFGVWRIGNSRAYESGMQMDCQRMELDTGT